MADNGLEPLGWTCRDVRMGQQYGEGDLAGSIRRHERVLEIAMTDATTGKLLCVSADGDAGPYIMVPVGQLDKVTTLLDANEVSYWVDEEAIALDDKPAVAVINFGHRTDPATIQRLLDSIP